MHVGEICNQEVITVAADESVQSVATILRKEHVGDVVVVDDGRKPVGIVTDRDLVLEVMVPGLDPADLTAREIATDPVVTVEAGDDLFAAMEIMEAKGVRRLPVVQSDGSLIGVLTVDDIWELLTGLQTQLAGVVNRQRKQERQRRP
ncbi:MULTISPECIES: CBS domain-containing protein [unclassified Guyparkeria]|uniref:CBS domain-containing protein n=1 Tax=unclassified Guyparkeria TaxID=2626246 RepID=UPI000733699C|nr:MULTISPECIES: CBS domain-containing protein [unclassified Guyparkeria]KTG17620.1 histidine kinase [Guyparkeria sp. XI15]OAE88433.1 histidine kinase [Guyparkeria sp. WRN-7]